MKKNPKYTRLVEYDVHWLIDWLTLDHETNNERRTAQTIWNKQSEGEPEQYDWEDQRTKEREQQIEREYRTIEIEQLDSQSKHWLAQLINGNRNGVV